MNFIMLLLSAIIAYVLGSLNSGIIFTRIFTGSDLRDYGSGNAGSTNAFRVLGPKAFCVVLGDILKGVAAILIGRALMGENGMLCAYIFVLFGHIYPVFFDFRGGKGILTAAAALAVVDWRVTLILFSLFLVIVFVTKYISLGSVISISLTPLVLYLFGSVGEPMVIGAMLMAAWMVTLHRENIKRLIAGTERKFSFRKTEQK